MSEKILSISVAAYNVEKYLVKLFEILNISPEVNQKIEVIIVNDGSTDKTLEIANRFKSQYPQSVVIIDKKNGGYGSTINSSIATVSYTHLSDPLMTPTSLRFVESWKIEKNRWFLLHKTAVE